MVHMSRHYLNSAGYDASGFYWGEGAPLYRAELPCGDTEFVRGRTREHAKAEVRRLYFPTARFYR